MNKKGDISLNFLAGLIVSIVGFSLLLFVYFQIASGGEIDRQVCHESVILRATVPLGESFVPLKCNTAKICISGKLFGKGECEEFKNEKSVTTIRVGDNADSLNKIEKVYAQELLSCWKTMGEGKISIFSNAVVENFGVGGEVYPSCVICSRIAVDKNSFQNVDFTKMDVFGYMNKRLVPESDKTYLQQITNNPNNVGISTEIINTENLDSLKDKDDNLILIEDENGDKVEVKFEAVELSEISSEDKVENFPSETAILFMQISAPEYGTSLRNVLGVGTAGTVFVARGASWKILKGAVGVVKQHPIIAAVTGVVFLGYHQGSVAWNRAVTASYCDDISIGKEARSGCSVVRATDYKVANILEYCQVIESIP